MRIGPPTPVPRHSTHSQSDTSPPQNPHPTPTPLRGPTARFTLSRRNVVLQDTGQSDFMPMMGLPGFYVANSIDTIVFSDKEYLDGKIGVFDRVQSFISRNDGSSWQPLPPPKTPEGEPEPCQGLYCNLQVHGPDAWWRGDYNLSYAGYYTHPSAPGVVFTTGNPGAYLSYDPEIVNTYVSSDGGESFSRAAKGAFIYEVGDWGSILAMAKHAPSGEAKEVLFSLDQGKCWTPVVRRRRLGPVCRGTAELF